jgi:hypothetical protein
LDSKDCRLGAGLHAELCEDVADMCLDGEFAGGEDAGDVFVRQSSGNQSEDFHLIDSATHPVIIPWGEKGQALGEELRTLAKYGRFQSKWPGTESPAIQLHQRAFIRFNPRSITRTGIPG